MYVYVLFCAASLSLGTEGKIPIDRLRRTRPMLAGASEKLYAELSKDPFVPGRLENTVVSMNQTSMGESYEELYNAMVRLDRNLATAIDAYVDSNLSEYNKIAYRHLADNRTAISDGNGPEPLNRAIDVLRYDAKDGGELKLYSYLLANGKDVENKLNAVLFYTELKRLPEVYSSSSFETLMEHLERLRDTDGAGPAGVARVVTAQPMDVDERMINEGVWEEKSLADDEPGPARDVAITEDVPETVMRGFVFMENALNNVREIPPDYELDADEENERNVAYERFVESSNSVADRLDEIRQNLRKLTNLFDDEWDPWTDFRKLHQEFYNLPAVLKSELFNTMTNISCTVQVTKGVGVQKDIINAWDCDDILSEDPKSSNTAVWTGRSTVNYIKEQRIQISLNGPSEGSSSNSTVSDRTILLKIPNMFIWILQNFNINNRLIGYNIIVDAYILLIGQVSNDLLNGAIHILFCYCINEKKLNAEEVTRSINHINIMNSYLYLFYKLFIQAVDGMAKKWSVDVTKNVYVQNMKSNLSLMIRTTKTSNYQGENDGEVLSKMNDAVNKEYGKLINIFDEMHVTIVKYDLLSKPVLYMQMFKNVFNTK